MTEIYKTKTMSSINEYKNSVDMDEEIISEVEDKTEEKIYIYYHIYEHQRIKHIENTEVRIRRDIFKNRAVEMKEEVKTKQNNEHGKYVGKSKVKLTVQSNTVNVCYSLKKSRNYNSHSPQPS